MKDELIPTEVVKCYFIQVLVIYCGVTILLTIHLIVRDSLLFSNLYRYMYGVSIQTHVFVI